VSYSIDSGELREQLRWLIRLRWIGIIGVFVATHMVREVAFLSFSLIPVYAILGFSAFYNVYFNWALKFPKKDPRFLAVSQIFLDQLTLSFAMYFSGGCDSPFIYFFIFHIVISGIILHWKYTFVFAVLAVFFPAVVMGLKHLRILPHVAIFTDGPAIFVNPFLIGSYGLAFMITVFLTAYFVTYLSRRLYERNEEVKRLYALSERLRSSIRIGEVISIIEKELCGFTGISNSAYMSLDKNRRVLLLNFRNRELKVPLIDRNSFTEALFRGSAIIMDYRTISSEYDKTVLNLLGSERLLLLPVMAASISTCYEYFHCNNTACGAHGVETARCWQLSGNTSRGMIRRNYIEKLDGCLSCELFTPVGIYALNLSTEYMPLEKVDMNACMRLLDAAGLAVSNALLYEKTLGLSKIDGLTGLWNHREFKEAFETELRRAKRYGRNFSLLMLDIDDFKLYNDAHGHPQGDVLITKVSTLIRENLKETDVVARYGGEEFAVLLLETPKEEALIVAERLRLLIDWCKFPNEESQPEGKVTISAGVSGYPDDGEDVDTLLAVADSALYSAKRNGKNRVAAPARHEE
jgi:diguanylate cyclase (GGDEF)-like protein